MLVPTAISTYNAKLPGSAPDRGVLRQVDTMNEIYAALPNMQKVDAWSALQAAAAEEDTDHTRASGNADDAQPVAGTNNAGSAASMAGAGLPAAAARRQPASTTIRITTGRPTGPMSVTRRTAAPPALNRSRRRTSSRPA